MTNLRRDDNFSNFLIKPRLFKSGLIRAVFKDSGKIAWFNDALTIHLTIRDDSSTHSLSSQLGSGSSSQDLLGAFKICRISCGVTQKSNSKVHH